MDDAGWPDASAVAAAAATANAGHLPLRPSEHLTPRVTRGHEHRERKCADTTGTVPVPWASPFQY